MKLTVFFSLLTIIQLWVTDACAQLTKLSLKLENIRIADALTEIENKSEFYFLYSPKLIDVERRVNIEVDQIPIKKILLDIFNNDVNINVFGNQVILTPADSNSMIGSDQLLKISGRVTDSKTGEALPGVNIHFQGSNIGAISDLGGNYSIYVPSLIGVLRFSFIGYDTEDVRVEGRHEISIVLNPAISELNEVIVVGYGTQSKRSVTGSIQSLSTEELTDMPVTTMTQKLQGKLIGVQINQTTGRPGLGIKVRIRGQASLSAGNDPLYVIDGFPIIGDINEINPNEIESISVLKDASSTSLYGSRAANGVILVTTKKAKAGTAEIDIISYYGWQEVPERGRPEMMNGSEFAQFKKESYEDKGLPVPEQFKYPEIYSEGWNYYNAILRKSPIQDLSVSMSSSKEGFNTTAIIGVFKQKGVVLNSDNKRYSLRLNSDFKVVKWAKAGFNVAPLYSVSNTPNTDGQFWTSGLINNSLLTWPIFPYKNTDGSIPLMSWDPEVCTFPTPNYYRAALEIINEFKNIRLLVNSYLQADPISDLQVKSTINIDYGSSVFRNINPSTASGGFATALPATSSARFNTNQYSSWLNENTITYKKSIAENNFDILGGFTIQRYMGESLQIAISGFPDDRIPTIGSASSINRTGTGNTFNDIQEWSLLSFLARLNYNFRNKYLVTAAIRSDGSSRFGADNRWGTFPSVAAGWIISDENFMKAIPSVSLLKLRTSFGVVGNNNIGNYTQYATVRGGSSEYNAIFGTILGSGSAVTQLPNSMLTWEQTIELDLGFDLGLFNNRLNIGYDYFTRKTNSLLYSLNVAQESGFTTFNSNIGELHFWGHEVNINSQNLTGFLAWNTDFNISFSNNRVNELYNLIDRIYGDGTITKVGGKIGLFYGLIHDGVYKDQADFETSPKATLSEVGTAKFRDTGGAADGEPDGKITYGGDNDDRTIIGDPTPKFIFGLTNIFSCNGFDLSIITSGSYGNDIANRSLVGLTNLDGVFNVLKEVNHRWRSPENPGKGVYGKTTSGTAYERDWFNSRFVSDASYLCIKNVTVGYSIPKSKLKNVKELRFYFSIQQLYTFTNYDGVNPEVSMTVFGGEANALNLGSDYGGYPVPRTLSFGLNLGL
jgi:TonB-linked SusC/RagA family outer membrane protein